MRANGFIHGSPIQWSTGHSSQPGSRFLIATVAVGMNVYAHCRWVDRGRAFQCDELSRAYLYRELTRAEKELRKRVRMGAPL